MQIFKTINDTFPAHFYLMVGEYDEGKIQKYFAKEGAPQSSIDILLRERPEDTTQGRFWDFTVHHVIWIYDWDNHIAYHEMLHAVFAVMRTIGILLTEDSEETFCYMLSFLSRWYEGIEA